MLDETHKFYVMLKSVFGVPRLAKGTSLEIFLQSFDQDLAGYTEKVYGLAAKNLRTTREQRSFPSIKECLDACRQANRSVSSDGTPTRVVKRDWSDPEVAKSADAMLVDKENINLAITAMEDGWLLDLWRFCAEKGRMPLACTKDGDDEQWELQEIRQKTEIALAHHRAHPNGSICRECALERGAKPSKEHVSSYWEDECLHCNKIKSCCAITDWNWPLAGMVGTSGKNLTRLRIAIEERQAKERQRLLDLLRRAA